MPVFPITRDLTQLRTRSNAARGSRLCYRPQYAGARTSMKTIGVDLWGDQIRGGGNNSVTCLQPSTNTPRQRRPFRDLFLGAYSGFAERCREINEPGIALVAIDESTGRAQGLVRLLARV